MTTALGSVGTGEGAAASGGAGNPGTGGAGGSSDSGSGQGGGTGTGAAGSAPANAGSAGGNAASWRDSLPEDIRSNPAISSFKDVTALTQSFIHAQSLVGKKGAIAPADWSKATDQEKKSFFEAAGLPASDKYTITPPKEAKIPQPFLDSFKEQALKAGVLPHQANDLIGWFAKTDQETQTKAETARKAADVENLKALKAEWGGDEAWDRNLKAIAFATRKLGGDEAFQVLHKDPRIGNNVPILKALLAASKMFNEDTLREGGVGSGTASRSEIEAQLHEIRMNGKANGYWDKTHPNHSVIVAKVENLAKQLTGGR